MQIKPGVDPEGVDVDCRYNEHKRGTIKDYLPSLGEVLVEWWDTGRREWVPIEDVNEVSTVTIEKGDK